MNLHWKLRRETKEQHTKIESVPLLKKMMAANIRLDQYQILLQMLYGYIAPCEAIIQNSSYHYLLDHRKKTVLLESDLVALGLEPCSIATLPCCSYLPELNDFEQMLGYLYIMEGATLGGQVITKVLKGCLNITPEQGLLYFHGYGKNTSARWDKFCNLLNEIKEEQHTKIIASVNRIFATLYDWMVEHDPFSVNL